MTPEAYDVLMEKVEKYNEEVETINENTSTQLKLAYLEYASSVSVAKEGCVVVCNDSTMKKEFQKKVILFTTFDINHICSCDGIPDICYLGFSVIDGKVTKQRDFIRTSFFKKNNSYTSRT